MNIGFIGCGNMAKAMIKGIISSGVAKPQDIIASDVYLPALNEVKENLKINTSHDNTDVVKGADVVFIAVKPRFYEDVISEIKPDLGDDTIVVSITPSYTLKDLEDLFDINTKIVRIMPNTPAMVGEGMTAMCLNSNIRESESGILKEIMEGFGRVEVVPEYMMSAVVAVSGSSPAYAFMFIEAMADAAVLKGMARKQAYTFAAQALLGSAKMVLETGRHPGDLKDMVCSPSGTTIEAVRVLEEMGFRASVIEAMIACAEKAEGK